MLFLIYFLVFYSLYRIKPPGLLSMLIPKPSLSITARRSQRNCLAQNGGLEPFSNRRHALIQVYGEKVVLRHYLDFAETALACLMALDLEDLISRYTVYSCRGCTLFF